MEETTTQAATRRERTPDARRARAREVNDALMERNDSILRDPVLVGTALLTQWRAFRDRWGGWYRTASPTTWWWDATSQVVESYAAELERFRVAQLRAHQPPPAMRTVPLADLAPAPAAIEGPDWSPFIVLGLVGAGLWWLTHKDKVARGEKDPDFGVKRVLERGSDLMEGIDDAQVPELQFEELDIDEDDDEEQEDPDEYVDGFGITMVRSVVPGFYVPKSRMDPTSGP